MPAPACARPRRNLRKSSSSWGSQPNASRWRPRARGPAAGVREAKEKPAQVVEQLGLAAKRDQMASSLTLPERKRLEVARALATGPRILLLDEVMAGLRPTEMDHMVALFRELNAKLGLTILLIEHVMRAVMALSSHIIVLPHGAVP